MNKGSIATWTTATVLAAGAITGTAIAASGQATASGSTASEQGSAGGKQWLAAMDTDHDGTVSQDEMTTYMVAQFKKANPDHDSTLDASEMAVFRKDVLGTASGSSAGGKQWLAVMDTDHDGTVSQDEMTTIMVAQFKKADADHDGTLDANELAVLRKNLMAAGKSQ